MSGLRRPARDLQSLGSYVLVLPAIVFMSAFFVLPLGFMAFESVRPNALSPGSGSIFANYDRLLGSTFYWSVILRTLRTAAFATSISLVLGYATGLVLKFLPPPLIRPALAAVTFPILAGPLIVILGWIVLLADGGPLIAPLQRVGALPPLHLIGTETAIIVSLVHFTLPFVILTLHATLMQIPDSAVEAAASLGATRPQILLHVLGPLSVPGVLSAALIAFTLAGGSYVSPHYMGGAAQPTLATIVSDFVLGTYNTPMAAAASVVLIALMGLMTVALTALLSRSSGA